MKGLYGYSRKDFGRCLEVPCWTFLAGRSLFIPPAPFKGGGPLTLVNDWLLGITCDRRKTKSTKLPVE
jgi:hypothetical protein